MRALGLLGSVLVLTACAASPAPQAVPEAPQAVPGAAQAVPEPPRPLPPRESPTPEPLVVHAGDGRLTAVPGTSRPTGAGDRTTYVVEVEGALGIDPQDFATAVERILADPRSWSARRALQRVDDPQSADLRISLVSPRTTDDLCAPLRTSGYFSCANGDRAVLNIARWLLGAPSYEGRLQDYRAYVLNHEVGHTLGFGHAACPGPGRVAPVMLQQTKGLDGCAHGPWPYP